MNTQNIAEQAGFMPINKGYNNTFHPNRLTLGLVVPLESYPNSPVPTMIRHIERVQLVEQLGFAAIWLRDVPFNVPTFQTLPQLHSPSPTPSAPHHTRPLAQLNDATVLAASAPMLSSSSTNGT